jgi:hypothetical protein
VSDEDIVRSYQNRMLDVLRAASAKGVDTSPYLKIVMEKSPDESREFFRTCMPSGEPIRM